MLILGCIKNHLTYNESIMSLWSHKLVAHDRSITLLQINQLYMQPAKLLNKHNSYSWVFSEAELFISVM